MTLSEIPEGYLASLRRARTLGVDILSLEEVTTFGSGKMREYAHPESRKKAEKAMLAYKRMDEKTEGLLLDYERQLSRVIGGKEKLNITEGRCGICHQETRAGYSACAVCLDVYHQHAREGFLKSLDSCEALRIVDGV